MNNKILVVGQGYVGLPLALAACESGFDVTGLESNEIKVNQILSGHSPIEDISDSNLSKAINSGSYRITNKIEFDQSVKIICVCVPTPLDSNHQPDLRVLELAVKNLAQSLQPGTLVIIESTIQPGTTRNVVIPILEKESGLNRDQFLVAYSPERIDPANKKWKISNTPKLVAGLTDEAVQKAKSFYSKFIEQVEICDSLEVAETAKLLENTFRLINISFINELAIFCQKIGIDINDVVKAAARSKLFGS